MRVAGSSAALPRLPAHALALARQSIAARVTSLMIEPTGRTTHAMTCILTPLARVPSSVARRSPDRDTLSGKRYLFPTILVVTLPVRVIGTPNTVRRTGH